MPNTESPGTAGNTPPPAGYQKPMEAHDSRIYFEQHTPEHIPPGDRMTWSYVIAIALTYGFNAVEIHKWMKQHHKILGYALPQRRTVRKWVDNLKHIYCPKLAP